MQAAAAFRYTALRPSGERCSGVVRAPNEGAARARLAAMGTLPVSLVPTDAADSRSEMPGSDGAVGLRLLADLLASGLPIEAALETLGALAPAIWREALPALLQAIREGETLASALAQMPRPLASSLIGIVQAGEAAGSLGPSLMRAATYAESQQARAKALRAALAYPSIVLGVGVVTLAVLVFAVIPRFASLLLDMGARVPRGLALLLGTADFLRSYGAVVVIGAVLLLAAGERLLRSPQRRRQLQRLLLAAPIVGPVIRASLDARLLETVGSAVDAGVPLRRALEIAIDAERHLELRHRLAAAREAVLEGQSLGRAFERFHVVGPVALTLVAAGERTGRVSVFCLRAAAVQADEAERRIRAALRFLEPGLILGLALVVGLVSSALLQAVYAVRPQ